MLASNGSSPTDLAGSSAARSGVRCSAGAPGSRASRSTSRPGPRDRAGPPDTETSMTVLAREARASYAFVERNFNLTKRYWGWEIGWLVYALAGALSVTLIGQDQGNQRLVFSLLIGAIFWNYLSMVFGFIAETISWERWEGTLEYTMMAPIRRYSQLFGSTLYAVLYGMVHTAFVLVVLVLFFGLDLSRADFATAGVFVLIGSFSIV